ncbi:hypothetical protein BofuT4_uP083960.1 [Botrytis cinerea T4]|uniref:Uncharacterized protein n=1 Tax=Botryotinia fuckeliana (strain T4) TaxID=999810 RepID=G2YJS6_BOTF4|nr:hypothetical protein BofuT4_uP083960.1 [Botrytis cinerea T4]
MSRVLLLHCPLLVLRNIQVELNIHKRLSLLFRVVMAVTVVTSWNFISTCFIYVATQRIVFGFGYGYQSTVVYEPMPNSSSPSRKDLGRWLWNI